MTQSQTIDKHAAPNRHRTRASRHTTVWAPGPKVIKLFSYSTQLNTKFILLINVKIVGILTFNSMINTTSEWLQARNFFICRYFSFLWAVEISCSAELSMENVLSPRGQLFIPQQDEHWDRGPNTKLSPQRENFNSKQTYETLQSLYTHTGPEVIKLLSCSNQLSM